MAEWHIQADASGTGTSASDKASGHNAIKAGYSNGDRVICYGAGGLFRELVGELTVEDLTIEAADGPMPTWDGTTLIDLTWSVHSAAGDYTVWKSANSSFPAKPHYFYYDWQDGVGSSAGLRIGHVPEDTVSTTIGQAVTALGLEPKWWYDSANQRIFLSVPNDEDPNSGGAVEAAYEMTDNALKLSGDGPRVLGIGFQRWAACDLGSGNHWTTQFAGIEGGYMQGCIGWETGYHPFGSTGGKSHNHLWSSCSAYGLVRGVDSAGVAYAGGGQTVRGCVFEDLLVRMGSLRRYDGAPLESGNPLKALAGHAGIGSAIEASGLVYRRPVVIDYTDEHAFGGTQAFVWANGRGTAAADRYNPAQYPIRVQDGVIGCSIMGQAQSGGLVAVERTRVNVNSTTSGGISNACFNILSGGEVLLESTTVVGELDTGTANEAVLRTGGKLTLSNASVRADADTDAVLYGSASAGLDSTHSIFDRENAGRFIAGSSSMPAPTMKGNTYAATLNDSEYGPNTAFDTRAEWEASIDTDPAARYGVDLTAEIADTDTMQPVSGGGVQVNRHPTTNPKAPTGINGAAYGGNAGAWQTPGAAARGRSRTRRRQRSPF